MHEMSLVQGLFAQIKEVAKSHKAKKISKVVVQIGPFSGVVTESFSFAFDVLKEEELLLKDAKLQLLLPDPTFMCSHCSQKIDGSKITTQERENSFHNHLLFHDIKCPVCKQGLLYPYGGDEILLTQIEME